MKQIITYINNIKCGKHLNEALRIKQKTKYASTTTKFITVDIPKCDNDAGTVDFNDIIKTIKLPKKRFIIYKDNYRGGRPHLGSFDDDFLCQFCFAQEDFEDFDPSNDIIYMSDDLKEIARWYLVELLGCPEPNFNTWEENANEYEEFARSKTNKPHYDGLDVLYNFANGLDQIESYKINASDKEIIQTFYGQVENSYEVI